MYVWVRVKKESGEITHCYYDTSDPNDFPGDFRPIECIDADGNDVTEDDEHTFGALDTDELLSVLCGCGRHPDENVDVLESLDGENMPAEILRRDLRVYPDEQGGFIIQSRPARAEIDEFGNVIPTSETDLPLNLEMELMKNESSKEND